MSAVSSTTSSQNLGEKPEIVRGEITRRRPSDAETRKQEKLAVQELQKQLQRLHRIFNGGESVRSIRPLNSEVLRSYRSRLQRNEVFLEQLQPHPNQTYLRQIPSRQELKLPLDFSSKILELHKKAQPKDAAWLLELSSEMCFRVNGKPSSR